MRSQNLSNLLQHLQHLPAIAAEKDAWPSWLISGEASFNILTLNISKFHAETRVSRQYKITVIYNITILLRSNEYLITCKI